MPEIFEELMDFPTTILSALTWNIFGLLTYISSSPLLNCGRGRKGGHWTTPLWYPLADEMCKSSMSFSDKFVYWCI